MNTFTFLTPSRIQKIATLFCLLFLFFTPFFAQAGWHHNGDSTYFRHRPIHHPNDTIYGHRINDSIFNHCRFDSGIAHRSWNDTFYFHFDSTTFTYWHNKIDSLDSLRRIRLDSIRAHIIRRWDTICVQHNWDTIMNDTICSNHWFDTIITRHYRGLIVFYHRLRLESDKKSIENAVAAGSSNSTANLQVTVSIYPNPVGTNATLQIANSSGALNFKLYNVIGNKIMDIENLSNGSYQLNRANLPSGLYLYQVLNGNYVVSTGKVIIQ